MVLCVIDRRAALSYPGLSWPRRGVAGCQDRVARDSIISVILADPFDVRYYRLMLYVYGRTRTSLQIHLAMALVYLWGGLRPLEHVPRPHGGRGVTDS